jgi:hypothetical protein
MPTFRFPDGTATATGAYVVVQVQDDRGELIPGNLLADYRFAANTEGFATDWGAVSICYREAENVVYAAGGNGEIARISDAENAAELIASSGDGPALHGPIREIRAIGNDLFAVGMGRQVYRRIENRRWAHVDAGVLDTSDRVDSGLVSIAGDGKGFLVAVGYGGEIWECDVAWRQVDTPTNLLLTRVVAHAGRYYAAGLLGTLLCRMPEGWRIVDTTGFEHDVWDIESFRGTLYLGTAAGLFRMTPEEEVAPVDPATFTHQVRCTSLSAGRDRLWCFGGDIVSSTSDGVVWREETIL